MSAAAKRIVVLTGAGISAESGIATFRASDGLWENHRVEDVASPDGFARDPALVHRFYNARRAAHEGRLAPEAEGLSAALSTGEESCAAAQPNDGHRALAEFEESWVQGRSDRDFLLITQNIDALHERAGSKMLLHMHGELLRVRCAATGQLHFWRDDCFVDTPCPCCGRPGNLRPHVVWFGEVPLFLDEIAEALMRADLFVSIGTSGHVYPAAGFHQIAQSAGATTVELNLEPSLNSSYFDRGVYGPASQVVRPFFRELLE